VDSGDLCTKHFSSSANAHAYKYGSDAVKSLGCRPIS